MFRFFLALLEKVALCPWESANVKKQSRDTEEVLEDVENLEIKTEEPPKKRFRGYREDPFIYFNDDEGVFDIIRQYYDLSLPPSQFLHRNKEVHNRFCTGALCTHVRLYYPLHTYMYS